MKHHLTSYILHLTLPLAAAALLFVACNNKAPKLNSMQDTLSWAMGENVGRSILSGEAIDIDHDVFLAAVRQTLNGGEQPLSDSVYMLAMQHIITTTQIHHMKKANEAAASVDAAQQEFFTKLEKDNPGIKRHPSGFYYEMLRDGKGPKAKYAQRINFDYKSFLMLTGEPFDQTYGKRDPITHVIGNPMFPGLIEAFQLMNAGSIYRFYFPYQQAFGANGSGNVPGYTPLIYEVELHELYND